MSNQAIISEYQQMTKRAESAWSEQSGIGKFTGLPEGYSKIGIAVGSKFTPSGGLASFLDELENLSKEDSSLTLVPRAFSHFTFLALAGHHWDRVDELPTETTELMKIVGNSLSGLEWRLQSLRLVPGKNFLLLAGLPSIESQTRRIKLAEELKSSNWKKQIEKRYEYQGFPFPPIIWHTTLCRYQHEFLPSPARDLYFKYKGIDFGAIDLGTPNLYAVNYDWSFSRPATQVHCA